MKGCLEYNVKWIPGSELGRGFFGRVYELSNDGRYVMKLLKIEDQYDDDTGGHPGISVADFDQEIEMQNMFATLGVAVPVVDSWMCNGEYGVIVMRRLSRTLKDYLEDHDDYDKDVIYKTLKRIEGIHRRNFLSHGDYTLYNIMVDPNKYHPESVELNIDGDLVYLYLIDFGLAKKGQEYNKDIDLDYLDLIMKSL